MITAYNDIIQKKIETEIENRERILRETYKNLQKTTLENKFFQSVLDDYEKYYTYIREDKQKQYNAFKHISDYLDGLIMNTDTLNDQVESMKEDQKIILTNLAKIRGELDDITHEETI